MTLDPAEVTLPGPYLDRSLEILAAALHGDAIADDIARERRRAVAAAP